MSADERRGVPKLIGADCEFANFIEGIEIEGGTARAAVRLLLTEVDGPPAGRSFQRPPAWSGYASWQEPPNQDYHAAGSSIPDGGWSAGGNWWPMRPVSEQPTYNPQDVGRRYQMSNGGCVYEDLTHYEACIPEVLSASDFTAAIHASFLGARSAASAANDKLPSDRRVVVMANNTDGVVSWGSHFNVAISRNAFRSIVDKLYPNAFFLGAFQASSQLFTGQGKVGAANGRPWCDFQLSHRADFIESFFSHSTTSHRPLVNARDEALCGEHRDELARLHIISFDHTLQQVATYLKCGATQLVVAMIEAGWVDRDLILEDPLEAMWHWSRDPDLNATALMADGRNVSMVDHQLLMAERASRFVEEGGAEGIVPEAERILQLWKEVLSLAEQKDFSALASRVDWALKRLILERALKRRSDLDWRSPEIRHLDLMYASVLEDGLYFRNASNLTSVVTPGQIERFMHEPPADTRAWTRAKVLRAAFEAGVEIESVDWDELVFKIGEGWNAKRRVFLMPDPFGHTRQHVESHFEASSSFEDLLDRLTAVGSADGAITKPVHTNARGKS